MVADTPLETWERIMAVNATGTFLGSKHAIPEMKRSGGGSIVNMSSGAGIVGNADGTAYGPAKGAVKILTKTTAHQYATRWDTGQLHPPGPYRHAHAPRPDPRDGRARRPHRQHSHGKDRNAGGDCVRGAVPSLGRIILCHGYRIADRRGSGEHVVARLGGRDYNRE